MPPVIYLLFLGLFSVCTLHAQENAANRQRALQVAPGLLYAAERDQAYSSLPYRGTVPGIWLGYGIVKPTRTVRFWGGYGAGALDNRFGARVRIITASIFNYTLYERKRPVADGLRLGWSNQNALSLRDFENARNYSPRFDYHTSFGPAIGYRYAFAGRLAGLELSLVGHVQVLGFFLQSGYVSNAPDETLGGDSGFGAFLRSIQPFVPGRDWNWGSWSQLRYRLGTGTELGLAYRYDRTTLTRAHRSTRSHGLYLLTLTAKL